MGKTHSIHTEFPIIVTPSLACHLGLDVAVMVQKIHFLCETPNSGILIGGRKWIYNTLAQWCAIFPFWKPSMIRRLLADLEERGILMSCQPAGNNRVKCYRINEGVYEALTVEALESLPSAQNEQFQVLKLSRCYKTEESAEESKGCGTSVQHSLSGGFSDRNRRPYPQDDLEFESTLRECGVDPDCEHDGGFYEEMVRKGWKHRGKPLADWVEFYRRRLDVTQPKPHRK